MTTAALPASNSRIAGVSHDTPTRRRHQPSRRSTSPRVSFTPSPHPTDKGVKNIALKVIRKLDRLGYLDEEDTAMFDEIEEEGEVEDVLQPAQNGHATNGSARTSPAAKIVVKRGALLNGHATPADTAKKIDWEIPRKAFHSSIGFVTVYLYVSQGNPRTVVVLLWTALTVIAPADFIRLRYPKFERIYEKLVGFLMRESEKHTTNGVIWYILGANFALTFYPLDVATVAILILSWADTAASTIGRLWGSRTPKLPARLPILRLPLAPRKSLAGFLAATVTGACIAVGFWGWMAPMRADRLSWTWENGGWLGLAVVGLVAGIVSGVAEALDLGDLDDNMTLPIIAGGCILGFFKLAEAVRSWVS